MVDCHNCFDDNSVARTNCNLEVRVYNYFLVLKVQVRNYVLVPKVRIQVLRVCRNNWVPEWVVDHKMVQAD